VTHSRSTDIRIKDAADLLGVSDDTVRRWIDSGALAAAKDVSGRTVVAGDVRGGNAMWTVHRGVPDE
jgi:excisionase family DNA binding protein